MADWLDVPQALALTGLESEDVDAAVFEGALDAACSWVEGKRSELVTEVVPATDPITWTFTPTPEILFGTAMLAHRWSVRHGAPLGTAQYAEFGGSILRNDPDIARLLGLGEQGSFNFGAGSLPPAEVVI